MTHADEDPLIRTKTDDNLTGNDVRLVSLADEDAGVCEAPRTYHWQGVTPLVPF